MMTPASKLPRRSRTALWAPALGLLLAAGCSSAPRTWEGAFSEKQQMKGNSESIAAPMDQAWSASMAVLAQQGFLVQQADATNHVILATREIHDAKDDELTYTISATLTLAPAADRVTRVMLAANQTTEMHTQEHTWWHLLWMIPLFPTGTSYTTVVTDRDTVQSPQFYGDFFAAVKASCASTAASPPVAIRN
jgi:hypothetical protein